MKQSAISISFDTEKISAIKRYMGKKNANLEAELASQLQRLYEKHVPASVREYIDESGAEEPDAPTRRTAKEAQT